MAYKLVVLEILRNLFVLIYICNNRTLIIILFELLSVISPVRVRCKLIISGRAPDSLLYCSPLYITLCFCVV